MSRTESFQRVWASDPVPGQFESPPSAIMDLGWQGGAQAQLPEAKWENWWHNRVDEALHEIEENGSPDWFGDVPYKTGALSHAGEKNWVATAPNEGINPVGPDNEGQWVEVGALASESACGFAKIATQPQVDAGQNDTSYVTPKKLRLGFSIGLGSNGYIAFPSWLGGLILQWGNIAAVPDNAVIPVAYPIQFPTAVRFTIGGFTSDAGTSGTDCVSVTVRSKSGMSLRCAGNNTVCDVNWLAIGH